MWVGENESAKYWATVLNGLKNEAWRTFSLPARITWRDSLRRLGLYFPRRKSRIASSISCVIRANTYVLVPTVRQFLKKENHQIDLLVDNTETLLAMLERGELDFAIIEGVFDKEKYPHRLYKKESFLGICSRRHSFAGWTVSLEEVLQESLLVREKGSGTRMLLEQAVAARGYSLDSFSRHSSISNFSIICDLVAMDHLITFAYEPISHCRNDLATFRVEDMEITGVFNLVYINRSVTEPKADLFLATC